MKTDSIPFGLSFIEVIILIVVIVGLALLSLIVMDLLNVKSFNFRTGFTFYENGTVRKSRITGRKKTVRRRAVKK
jgi:hypothetical protein